MFARAAQREAGGLQSQALRGQTGGPPHQAQSKDRRAARCLRPDQREGSLLRSRRELAEDALQRIGGCMDVEVMEEMVPLLMMNNELTWLWNYRRQILLFALPEA